MIHCLQIHAMPNLDNPSTATTLRLLLIPTFKSTVLVSRRLQFSMIIELNVVHGIQVGFIAKFPMTNPPAVIASTNPVYDC